MATLPVIFTIDKNYVMPLSVTLASLFKNNTDNSLVVYVIHNNLSENDEKKLHEVAKPFSRSLQFIKIESTTFIQFKTGFHFSSAIFFRLLIPELFKDKYNKVLYIDSDALVLNDILPLFQTNLDGKYVAAVENIMFDDFERLQLNSAYKYFASGTLLFNINKWNKDSITDKTLAYLLDNNKVKMPDQDALNVILDGKWKKLDLRYGTETIWVKLLKNKNPYFLPYKSEIEHPVIVHFSGSCKPWHYLDKKPYKQEFWEYLSLTPFKNYKFPDKNLKNMIEKYLPEKTVAFLKKYFISTFRKLFRQRR